MSTGITIKITKDNRDRCLQEIQQALHKSLEECGLVAEGYAKTNLTRQHAVDTGNLRNSITHKVVPSEKAVYIGTPVEYAPYIEFGTGVNYEGGRRTSWVYKDKNGWHMTNGMKARPYLKPALEEHRSEYQKIFESNGF